MFSFLGADKGKRREHRLAPLTDIKIGPFRIGSTSSTPNSECTYTALTSSTETAVDIPLANINSQQCGSTSSFDSYTDSPSPPPGYKPPAYYSALLGATTRRSRYSSRKCKLITLAVIVLPCIYIFCYITFRPPSYIILPPEKYVEVLRETMTQHIPSQAARQALTEQLARIEHPDVTPRTPSSEPTNPTSIVPATIWSSDGKPAPSAWFTKWSAMGFEPKFLDDQGAEDWITAHYDNSSVKKMWDSMPRFILKADLLRYLLMLDEGGTWSDMDTVPLMQRANWTLDAVPLSTVLPEDEGIFGRTMEREPVRAVIGIENDPNENYDPRNFFERWRLLPLRRHRPLQFVQWTLHAAPHHPIMLDTLRRVLSASTVYRGYEVESQREADSDGWGWGEKGRQKEQAKAREAHTTHPWDGTAMSWQWQAGHWRWGWNVLSVEEWTGPAVFTDAVMSYLHATAGVRPEDLSGLTKPVQVRDVVIVPSQGFNPARKVEGVSRLVHLFRGSWKG
ncbi:Glycosyltransferase, DXD sugar-binding motif [Kalmanozyma brasiliensis GHG001]|uniref:Alpha-1,6-mannosyltransferase n=1 Tax=Kalmanozyma brasiliensis (strain GHG001) TaxID=1365824 RepID=V5E5T6_KALBG|nr:Glycosyltransferase, DXD sugar-binding motif [Kalmanozyma brasiliensis GHG001]EST05561.1 Glycosyltransferase, DXD sugar-binding motif [Kalmanozyma brasiliensis GHG001]